MFAANSPRLADFTRNLGQVSGALWSDVAVPVIDRASSKVVADLPRIEAVLKRLHPTLSLRSVRAQVVAVTDETADTKTYWLRPNARFGSFRPGSFVNVTLQIDGQPVTRSYSLSSAARGDGLISITVKRVVGGRVSNWLADHIQPDQVIELSAPQGQFVLPVELPARLLMLSAGSGITPVMSQLRQLVAEGSQSEIVFMHFARTPRDIIFRAELERIARIYPNVRVMFCVEAGAAAEGCGDMSEGRFCEQYLSDAVGDFRSLDTYLCGPPGFMQVVMQAFERADADLSKLRYERFNVEFDASMFLEHSHVLRFSRSGKEAISNRARTILEEAESAGLPVEFGCRAGNCGTCRCRKSCGVVVDITTGRASHGGEEFIYPCISVPRGTVEVDL